jgi:ABC-type uncharacterized transport system auxiliary subunit
VRNAGLITMLLMLVSGCVSSRPIKYYRIEIPAETATPVTPLAVSLQVGTIDVPPLMRDGRILYRVGAHEMGAYEYHRWIETPDRLVQNSLVRLLRSSGKYQSVDTQRGTARPDYILQGKVYEFGEIDKPEVYTRVSMEIELRDATNSRTVWSRVYTSEDAVDGKSIPDVVASLDQSLRRGLSEIITGLEQYLLVRTAGGGNR